MPGYAAARRASAAMAAMLVKAPMRKLPSAPQCIPIVSGVADISISGPVETPLRRLSLRSVPAARNSAACVAVMADGVMRRPSL